MLTSVWVRATGEKAHTARGGGVMHEYTVSCLALNNVNSAPITKAKTHDVACGLDSEGDVVFKLDDRPLFWITTKGEFLFYPFFVENVRVSGLHLVNQFQKE